MELAETRGDVRLALLGILVFCVFREVPVRASDLDFLGQLVVELMLKGGDFVFQLFLNFFSKVSPVRSSRAQGTFQMTPGEVRTASKV